MELFMDQRVNSSTSDLEFKDESRVFNSRAEKFKLIFNASPDMIFILSHKGLILDANESALTTFEYEHDEAFGMSYEKLFSSASYASKAKKLFESAKRGTEIDYEWDTETKYGKKIPVEVRLRSLKLNDAEKNLRLF